MNMSYVAARAALAVVCLLASVPLAQSQTVPTPWSNRDIGAPALTGSATSSGGVLNIDAAGTDIWSESDQFHFVYQAVSGDVDIRARIDSLTFADEWSKAGVMIRSSLSAGAAHGYALVSAGRGVAFQRRRVSSGRSTHTPGLFTGPPHWVRLTRSGTTIKAFSSADGSTWSEIGSDTIALEATVYVGVAITSHNPGVRTTAAVSQVALASAATPDPAPTPPPASSGEASIDIDNPPISGATTLASGKYTITASGAGVAGTADQFRYVYRPVSGDIDVIARVESIAGTNPWAIAGLMIRESLAPGSRHAFAVASSREGSAFRYRFETDSEAEQSVITPGALPGWLRLVRSGSQFEAFRSLDGTSWTKLGSATLNIADTAYVGIAVASVAGTTATAIVSGLDIRQAGLPAEPLPEQPPANPPANVPPAIILSSPAQSATFVAPATVTMTASASDPDGTITAVDFYVNSVLVGRDTTAPYSFATSSLAAGTYAIKAVATDDDGATAISESVTITVTAPAASTAPRWVAFQASADHDSLVSGYVLEIYAANAVPGVNAPVAVSDLGKPTPSSTGEIMVDRSAFFTALTPGDYLAAVVAVGTSATARSAPIAFSR